VTSLKSKSDVRRERVEPGIYRRFTNDVAGPLEVLWKDTDGKQRRKTVPDGGGIREARKLLNAQVAQRDRGERVSADPRLTFNAAADSYVAEVIADRRPQTRATYGHHLVHLRAEFGSKRLTAIDHRAVRRYLAKHAAAGRKANTQLGHLTVLRAVFDHAIRDLGHVGPNPVKQLRASERPRATADQRVGVVISDVDVARLIGEVPETYRLLLTVIAESGARQSEALALTWGDVDFDAGSLRIEAQLSRPSGGQPGQRVPLKNSDNPHAKRTILLPTFVMAALAARKLATRHDGPGELVFPGITQRALQGVWQRAADRLELEPRPVIHDLRRTHVSKLIADGWHVARVARRIGDSLPVVLATYADLFDRGEDDRADLDRLANGSLLAAQDGSEPQSDAPPVVALAAV
jgi:integrase